MIHPRVLFSGDPGAATPWVGLAKKLARVCYEQKIANRTYHLGGGVKIRVRNIFPNVGVLAGISKVWIEAGTPILYGFIFHPHSDSATEGWWFSTELVENREVKTAPYYPKQSIRFTGSAWVNEWNYPYNRPNSLYKNEIFTRDLDVWCGNQFFTKDGPDVKNKTYWSWWHSPHGDGPLSFGTPTKQRLTPFLNGTYQLSYLSKVSPATYGILTPCVFKNGQLHWSYSDQNITDYTNTIDADDVMIVGGVYPVSDTRLIVVIVSNSARTATFYDIKILSSTSWTKSTLLTLTSTTISGSIRWPWRFNSVGTECCTIVEISNSSPFYYKHRLWVIEISYNSGTDTYSASVSSADEYYISHDNVRAGYLNANLFSGVGTEVSEVTTNISVNSSNYRVPYAVSYDASDTKIIAWYDVTGTTSSTYGFNDYNAVDQDEGYHDVSGETTSTNVAHLTIGSSSYELYNYTNTSAFNESYTSAGPVGPNDPYFIVSISETQTSSAPATKILYIDVKNKTLILESSNYYIDGTTSYGDDWTPNELWATRTLPINNVGTFETGRKLSKDSIDFVDDTVDLPMGTSIFVDPLDLFNSVNGFYYLSVEATINQTFDLGTTFSTYTRVGNTTLSISFGAVVDADKNYVFSYDWPEETIGSETLVRRTGNKSNIPTLAAQVVNTISGDNVLLFPLGLA